VLHDEAAITVLDDSGGEERFVTVGMDALGRVVVFTLRDPKVRLISAQRANFRERLRCEAKR
jgi:uncharacterized protein